MLLIKVFTLMDRLCIQVETSMPALAPRTHGAEPTLLHHTYHTYGDVDDPEDLYRYISEALKYANGYAGDLWDHIEA